MNVPKLRFKEFNDEWQPINLADIFQYFSTNSLSREQLSESGILKNLHYGDIHRKYNSIVNENKEITSYVKDLNYVNKYELLKNNDLIFADASEDYKGIGKAVEVVNVNNNTVSGLHTILVRDNSNVFAPMFKGYYFNSPTVHNQIRVLANGFKVYGISKEAINKLNIKIPSIKEQFKIANTLYLLDKKIELQNKKIEDLKLFKLYLQNKLYNANDTKDVLIKDLGEIVTGTTPSKSENKYWDNGNILWITPTDICENRDINDCSCKLTESGLAKGRFIPKNSILVTCIASIGKNAILKEDGSCNQQINAIIPSKDYNYNYIYYMIENLSNYMKSIAGTSATAIINKEQFGNINIKIHKREVQDKISKILNAFETKIIQEGFKYKKLQNLKKGLMQNMFV